RSGHSPSHFLLVSQDSFQVQHRRRQSAGAGEQGRLKTGVRKRSFDDPLDSAETQVALSLTGLLVCWTEDRLVETDMTGDLVHQPFDGIMLGTKDRLRHVGVSRQPMSDLVPAGEETPGQLEASAV